MLVNKPTSDRILTFLRSSAGEYNVKSKIFSSSVVFACFTKMATRSDRSKQPRKCFGLADREARAFVAQQNRRKSRRIELDRKRGISALGITRDENVAENGQRKCRIGKGIFLKDNYVSAGHVFISVYKNRWWYIHYF